MSGQLVDARTGEPLTCPRINPDTGERCSRPLPEDATYGPCPLCTSMIAARQAAALYERNARVAQALDDGYIIDETDQFVAPTKGDEVDEIIAGDRAGAPARRR